MAVVTRSGSLTPIVISGGREDGNRSAFELVLTTGSSGSNVMLAGIVAVKSAVASQSANVSTAATMTPRRQIARQIAFGIF